MTASNNYLRVENMIDIFIISAVIVAMILLSGLFDDDDFGGMG